MSIEAEVAKIRATTRKHNGSFRRKIRRLYQENPEAAKIVEKEVSLGTHTHTVCVPYYKAAPYNISHTKNFSMAIVTLIFFYKFFLCIYTMHEKWGQF